MEATAAVSTPEQNTGNAPASEAPAVDFAWKDDAKFKVTKIEGHEDITFPLRFKVYRGFDNLVAAFGGQSVAENVLAAAHENRTRGKAASVLRSKLKKGASVEDAIKAAQSVAEAFEYSERGVSAKRVGEAAQALQKEMDSQNLDPENMTPEQMKEWILRFKSL